MKPNAGSLVEYLTQSIGCSPYTADMNTICVALAGIQLDTRLQLMQTVQAAADDNSIMTNMRERVCVAKFLVAMVPDTEATIRKMLQSKTDALDYEVHFSLFCFLDHVPEIVNDQTFVEATLGMVEEYLNEIPRETARAAWMAGDLLGDHWTLVESIPVLLRVVRQAKYVAGRMAALHGLRQARARIDKEPLHPEFETVISDVAKSDPNRRVRERASRLLEDV